MKNSVCGVIFFVELMLSASAASPSTAFNYQGHLREGVAPANGVYDFRLLLYDDPSEQVLTDTAPSQNPYAKIGVWVTNGLFTMQADFGPNAFNGPPRWLEIWARTNFGPSWVVLSPRQELKPVPYTLYALQAGVAGFATNAATASMVSWNGITGLPAGLVDGVDNDTTYLAGFGLDLSETTFGLNLSQTDARYWTTQGNASTTPGTHFLGTTDERALVFKVNNQPALRLEPTFASPNLVAGHAANLIDREADGSAILSGGSTGDPNRVSGARAVVVGGEGNTNTGAFALLGGGSGNSILLANNSVLAGGALNRVRGSTQGFLGGGAQNELSGINGVVSGGRHNTNSGDSGFIGGGAGNTLQANTFIATIGGGGGNAVHTNVAGATISGGSGNTIQANADFASIGGGYFNLISHRSPWTAIGGGNANIIETNSNASSIGGGANNLIKYRSPRSTISGGQANMIESDTHAGTIGGGAGNAIGRHNPGSTIGGGLENQIIDSSEGRSTVGGGSRNIIESHSREGTIGGGADNRIGLYSFAATIAGGDGNATETTTDYAAIGGGGHNLAGGSFPTIGGGYYNQALSYGSTIGGGEFNTILAGAYNATIGGGRQNIASNANLATIPGGRKAQARSFGQFAYASGSIRHSLTGDSQASLYVLRARTTNNIQSDLFLDWDDDYPTSGTVETIRVPEGSVWTFRLQASALQLIGGELAAYEGTGVVTHLSGVIVLRMFDGAGNTITGSKPLYESPGAITWQVTPYVNGSGNSARLRIAVNGGVGQGGILWVASVHTTELMR